MVTDLAEVRRLAEAKKAENLEFRRHLTAHHQSLEPFHILASKIQSEIDCTQCGNCCRYTEVSVSTAEIEAIARYLGMPVNEVVRQYTAPDPERPGSRILLNTHDACVFLEGNLCMVYEARPSACRNFPHVAPRTHSLGGRVSSLCRRAWFCPIIYNALEAYKHVVGYHPDSNGAARVQPLHKKPGKRFN